MVNKSNTPDRCAPGDFVVSCRNSHFRNVYPILTLQVEDGTFMPESFGNFTESNSLCNFPPTIIFAQLRISR